jgi:signal transduction histidine kinase
MSRICVHALGAGGASPAPRSLEEVALGGRVRIRIEGATDVGAIVTVDDSGPHFGARGARRAGLGLEVTRRALDPFGGSLRIAKRGPLGGARAQLRMPSYLAQASPEAAPARPDGSGVNLVLRER